MAPRPPNHWQAKVEVIEGLLNISKAHALSHAPEAAHVHPTDANYEKLGCKLRPASADEVALVKAYAANTAGPTHTAYELEVTNVFAAERGDEAARGSKGLEVGNRQLLWHGSRMTNWVGILSQGLRIAPPEAPVTGYMFGKGVYFADCSTKSANYCFAKREAPEALLILCDVALGEPCERLDSRALAAPEVVLRIGPVVALRRVGDARLGHLRGGLPWVGPRGGARW